MTTINDLKSFLSKDEEDQYYIDDVTLEQHESIAAMVKATSSSWYRDGSKQRHYLYPSVRITE